MADRITLDDSINADAGDASRSAICDVALTDWLGSLIYGQPKENALKSVAENASKKLDEDMNLQTGRTSQTMLAAIDAFSKIPVNTAEGAYMWSHQNDNGSSGGILADWKKKVVDDGLTNLEVRGYAILFTAEGEGQIQAGSMVPNVKPYDLRNGTDPEYVLRTYADGKTPVGYDLGSTALASLYEAKRAIQLEYEDDRLSAKERAGLPPVGDRVIDDTKDILNTKHNMPYIVSQLSGKEYHVGGFTPWKQYIIEKVMPQAEKENWTRPVIQDGRAYGAPIQPFMRKQFEAKSWRDIAVLDLADIDYSLTAAAKAGENKTEASGQIEAAATKFVGNDQEKYALGYQGVWQALRNGREDGNADWPQLRDMAQAYAERLEQSLETLAHENPERYTQQLETIKAQLADISNSHNS